MQSVYSTVPADWATYVHGCELTIDMYICMCIYLYIGAEIYLQVYVECVGFRMYFVQESLIHSGEYKWRESDKRKTST